MKPVLVINFKTYEQGTGKKGLKIAKIADKIAKKEKANIIICVQFTDLYMISKAVKIPVYAQHIDPINYGSNTGWILPESIKKAGAKGTLLNHSEHKIKSKILNDSINRCKEIGLKTLVCANTPKKAREIARLNPNFIAIEPPELIGGDVSVSEAKPQVISKGVNYVKKINPKIPLLVGAGIKTTEDVKKSIELGAKGVLVASGILKAKNPERAIINLIKGFQ